MRSTYLRELENFTMDVAQPRSELFVLRNLVADYWAIVVRIYIEIGVEVIHFTDDLGHQDTLRCVLKPTFARIVGLCPKQSVEVYLHCDSCIGEIIPDLIEIGVTILNLQDFVNGLDNLASLPCNKITVDLHIDRQLITAFGTLSEINHHIGTCVPKFGSSGGALMIKLGV